VTHRLDAGPERRSGGVCDFQIRHAQTCLLAEEMRSKTVGRDTSGCFLLYLVHQIGVQCDILLPLLEHLGLPWGEDTGDVFQDGVALDGELSGDAIPPSVQTSSLPKEKETKKKNLLDLGESLHRLGIPSHNNVRPYILYSATICHRHDNRSSIPLEMTTVVSRVLYKIVHQHL